MTTEPLVGSGAPSDASRGRSPWVALSVALAVGLLGAVAYHARKGAVSPRIANPEVVGVPRPVEFLFGFTLAAGVVVLFAAVTATREERAREFAIMRAVGARGSLLRQVQRAELVGVGLLAGFLASVVAAAVGWALAKYAFDFTWTASPWVPIAGALAGAVLALAAGWWGLREVLARPVVETLRKAAE